MSETQQVEYKETWKDDFLKHICAFANSKGGRIFIGIKDDGTYVGVNNSKKLLEDIPNKAIQLLGITVDVDLQVVGEMKIIEIIVSTSPVPISYRSKYYVRSGSTIHELKDYKLREFILKKDNITWDEIAVPQANLDELDKQLMMKFVRKAVDANRLTVDSRNDSIDLILSKLDLLNSNGELTRAAILVFGKRPHKYIRTATLKIGRFGDSDADLISHDIIDGNILEMPEKALEILRTKYLHSYISYNGLERIETLEYPEKAIREALLNAIVHRDYGDQSDITIHVYNDKIVFWNSGELIEPLNIEMLMQKHPSKRRNALIAGIFFRIGYIEAWGRGITLMRNETTKAGLPEPVIEEFAGGIKVSFKKISKTTPPTTPQTTPPTPPIILSEFYQHLLTPKELEVLKHIIQDQTLTKEKLAQKMNISRDGIKYHIKKMVEKNVLKWNGPAKGGYWELAN
jgi:ATP-dependent DNA helicase RecG